MLRIVIPAGRESLDGKSPRGFWIPVRSLRMLSKTRCIEWSRRQFEGVRPPLITCEALLSEAVFLLPSHPRAIAQIEEYLTQETIESPRASRSDSHVAKNLKTVVLWNFWPGRSTVEGKLG